MPNGLAVPALMVPHPEPTPKKPSEIVTPPVKVFAPLKIQTPPFPLVTVRAPPLSASTELTVLASRLSPVKVSVFAPLPRLTILVMFNAPLPLASIVLLPVVMLRLIVRVTVSPVPV